MTATLTRIERPYVGPRPFQRDDSDRFFGRDSEVQALTALLYTNRAVVLHAPSGAGKTSLVTAGLFPQLESEQEFEILPVARVGGVAFDIDVANPFTANAIASWQVVDVEASDSLAAALQSQPRGRTPEGLSPLRLMVLDQFEELFTWYPDRWETRRNFMVEVREALEADSHLRVLMVIRDDFMGQLGPLLGELGTMSRANLRIDLLRRANAIAAVEGPLTTTNASFGPGVAAELVDELATVRLKRGEETVPVPGEFVEPVQLQVVCEALWENLPEGVTEITTEHWQTHGDVDQAVTDFYRESVNKASAGSAVAAEQLRTWVEDNLITEAGTRSTVFRGEAETAGMANQVLDELENLHVVRREKRLEGDWYELTHDRLVVAVDRARRAAAREKAEAIALRNQRFARRAVIVGIVLLLAVISLAAAGFRWTSLISRVEDERADAEAAALDAEAAALNAEAAAAELFVANLGEFGGSVAGLAADVEVVAAGEEYTGAERRERLADLTSTAASIEAVGASLSATLGDNSELASNVEVEEAVVAFEDQLEILADLQGLQESLDEALTAGDEVGPTHELTTLIGDLAQKSFELVAEQAVPTTQPPLTVPEPPTGEFALQSADQLIRLGAGAELTGTFLAGTENIIVGPDSFSTYIEAPTNDGGVVSFPFTAPEGPFEVWALVNARGQSGSNSMYLLIDRVYRVQNVPAGDVLNVRADPGPNGEILEGLPPDGVAAVCTDAEGSPIVANLDGIDWYQVKLTSATGSCLGGATTSAVGWVHSTYIAWEAWDMFEDQTVPPASWAWDRVSTRCLAGDTFDMNSCVLGAIDEPRELKPGEHLLTLRGREANARVAAIVIRGAS